MHYEVGNKFPKKFLSEAPALSYGRRYHLAVFRVTDEKRGAENVTIRERIDICAQCQCSPCCCANKQEDLDGKAASSL